MSTELMITIAVQVGTAIATIATLKTDIKWLKRWTREHAHSDEKNFGSIERRLERLEVNR